MKLLKAPSRLILLSLLAFLVSCGDSAIDDTAEEKPRIVVTTDIWADIVANVACGDLAEIETIVPTGADAHVFEPSLADRGRLERASLIVANGLGLEASMEDTLEATEANGVPIVRVAEFMPTIPYSFGDSNLETFGADPHVWFDPTRVIGVLPRLAERLVNDVGLEPEVVNDCAARYRADLLEVDAEMRMTLAVVPTDRRKLVTNHDSLGYLADRFEFEVVGTVLPSPSGLAETNPAQLEALSQLIEAEGVPAVFVDASKSTNDAEALADRVGDITVVTLFTESTGVPGAETYVDFLLSNAEIIADALGQ